MTQTKRRPGGKRAGTMKGSEQQKAAKFRDGAINKQRGRCYWCKEHFTLENYATAEHIIPWASGGQTNHVNVVAACYRCNQLRSKINSIRIVIEQRLWKRIKSIFWLHASGNAQQGIQGDR